MRKLARVPADLGQRRIELGDEIAPRALRPRRFDDGDDQLVDVHRPDVEHGPAAFHPVELEHVAECAIEPFGVLVDVSGERSHFLKVEVFRIADQLTETLDAYERGPELMADAGQELALHPVESLEQGKVGKGGRFRLPDQAPPPTVGQQDDREHGRIKERQARGKDDVELLGLTVDRSLHRRVGQVELEGSAG